MELQIVIFLAFTMATLAFNTLVILFAYKAFANISTKLTRSLQDFQTSGIRDWVISLEYASSQAVTITNEARDRISGFEHNVARAQSRFGFTLAKADVQFERLCNNVSLHAEKAQNGICRRAERIGPTVSRVKNLMELGQILGFIKGDPEAELVRK